MLGTQAPISQLLHISTCLLHDAKKEILKRAQLVALQVEHEGFECFIQFGQPINTW